MIVVDDGSTDPGTRAVIAGLDRERYRVVEQPNLGLARARNEGIAHAQAPYIIPLDADNRLHPVFLERAIAILDHMPQIGVVYGDAMYFGERNGRWSVGPFDFSRLLLANYIDACACIRRTVFDKVGGYDEHMPHMGIEDWDLWLRCSVAGVEFHYVKEIFFDYRVRKGSMLENTIKHGIELTDYILAKPGLRHLKPLQRAIAHRRSQKAELLLSNRELLSLLGQRFKQKIRWFFRK